MVVSGLHCKALKNLAFLTRHKYKEIWFTNKPCKVFHCFTQCFSLVFRFFDTQVKAEEYKNKHLL